MRISYLPAFLVYTICIIGVAQLVSATPVVSANTLVTHPKRAGADVMTIMRALNSSVADSAKNIIYLGNLIATNSVNQENIVPPLQQITNELKKATASITALQSTPDSTLDIDTQTIAMILSELAGLFFEIARTFRRLGVPVATALFTILLFAAGALAALIAVIPGLSIDVTHVTYVLPIHEVHSGSGVSDPLLPLRGCKGSSTLELTGLSQFLLTNLSVASFLPHVKCSRGSIPVREFETRLSPTSTTMSERPNVVLPPPDLPPYLKNVHELKPIIGPPTDSELLAIHAVVRAAQNASNSRLLESECED
ncbi:hypothetical protein AG1IA_08847 [Rhizoctonia solani AG-1 IA]|uniref:Uncharacterized protein n=1 Tax=Thanatephorus cucumeris (strain AG1-IA) TaxID=983506 RepID=L8WG15_THACA|nr:hypothetical protein AG1IA_08847 [Rhizoctonia solani AG-1 IA]